MGLLDKLKAALGLGSSTGDRSGRPGGTDVTVEYEPDAESEAAVKGTEESEAEPGAQDTEESSAAGASAAGSTESITEEPPEGKPDEGDEVQAAAEPGEAAGPPSQGEADLESDIEPAPDTEAADTDTAAEEAAAELDETKADTVETESEEATEPEASGESEEPGESEEAHAADESVTTLDGIGPAYGERLSEAGVETVGELREADAVSLADETGLSEKRVSRWIDRAGG